jgi:hypothetical protein
MPESRRYHRAHDIELRQWAEAGDLQAELERVHREKIKQMVHDLTVNPQTSFGPPDYVVPLSKNLRLRVQKGGASVVVSLLLDERTPKQDILNHWDEITAWQERLRKWQGPRNSTTGYVASIAHWHGVWGTGVNTDPSYATLAQWLNKDIAANLAMFVKTLRSEPPPGVPPVLERLLDLPFWSVPPDHWASSLFDAIRIMDEMGMSPEAIRDYCMRAVATLTTAWTEVSQQGGAHTFDKWWEKLLDHVQAQSGLDGLIGQDYPIDRDRLLDKLKQWRKQRPPEDLHR